MSLWTGRAGGLVSAPQRREARRRKYEHPGGPEQSRPALDDCISSKLVRHASRTSASGPHAHAPSSRPSIRIREKAIEVAGVELAAGRHGQHGGRLPSAWLSHRQKTR